jgi:hypothetical protein
MAFPAFFDQTPTVVLRDPLAAFLGAAEDGVIEYRYADAVRLAGHSCPTVAAAWLMGIRGLQALWPNELPVRGGVRVAFREAKDDGVTGVIANVVGLLTGAVDGGGFKGIGGRFDRRLARFAADLPLEVRFTRLDNGAAVDVAADLSGVPFAPAMRPLMAKVLDGLGTADEAAEFGRLWQDRVRRILLEAADQVIRTQPVP